MNNYKENENDLKIKVEGNYKINFYFNEEKEIFCETCSNNDLKEFIISKYLSLKIFFGRIFFWCYLDNQKYKNKLKEKDIYFILLEKILRNKLEIKDEEQLKNLLAKMVPFIGENKELISSYIKNTNEDPEEPEYFSYFDLIESKINKIVYNILKPMISFNYKLDLLFLDENATYDQLLLKNEQININKNKKNLFTKFKDDNLKKVINNNYININEIISSIKGTIYHSDENLNSLFQIKAINYIINDNSYFFNFICELYKALYYYKKEKISEKEDIEETFTIKINKGKKFTHNDFNLLKIKREEEIKKISEKKINKNKPTIKELEHSQKVQYKLCKYDTDFDIKYKFPFSSIYRLNGKIYKPQKIDIYKFFGKKTNFFRINKFINVYDLIFTIRSIDKNNLITIEKNDISEILKPYSEKNMFKSLLNQSFSFKNTEETYFYMTPIILYLKNKS